MTEPLPPGYKLGEYIIERKLGGGGFSMVYLAFDPEGQTVVIKEYLPGGVVRRDSNGTVKPITEDQQTSFHYGMKCFFDEARALADIHHPNVVRVIDIFRANDTVYMVMRYERGRTLQQHIAGLEEPMRESFIRHVFVQVLSGLREVHAHRLLHLDLKPSNIFIRNDGTPLIIDFGASRQVLKHDLQKASPMYTPGYAAPELYLARDCLGPWTDLYAIGACLYACIAREPPPPADERLEKDRLVSAAEAYAGQYSRGLLELIDSLLRLDHTERPQSVYSVQKRLIELKSHGQQSKPTLFGLIKERLSPFTR